MKRLLRACFPDGGWLSTNDVEVMHEINTEDAEMPWAGAVSAIATTEKRFISIYVYARRTSPAIRRGLCQNTSQLLSRQFFTCPATIPFSSSRWRGPRVRYRAQLCHRQVVLI